MDKKLSEEEIQKYINEVFTEEVIRRNEDQLLFIYKTLFEKYPTEKNSNQWLDFTNFVCRRRGMIVVKSRD